ncbi:hypothetical protein D3C81_1995510 [compost metagenome]
MRVKEYFAVVHCYVTTGSIQKEQDGFISDSYPTPKEEEKDIVQFCARCQSTGWMYLYSYVQKRKIVVPDMPVHHLDMAVKVKYPEFDPTNVIKKSPLDH